jgi:hypothetical protein
MARPHAELIVLRVRPDCGLPDFCAGLRIDRPYEPGNIHFEKYW